MKIGALLYVREEPRLPANHSTLANAAQEFPCESEL